MQEIYISLIILGISLIISILLGLRKKYRENKLNNYEKEVLKPKKNKINPVEIWDSVEDFDVEDFYPTSIFASILGIAVVLAVAITILSFINESVNSSDYHYLTNETIKGYVKDGIASGFNTYTGISKFIPLIALFVPISLVIVLFINGLIICKYE